MDRESRRAILKLSDPIILPLSSGLLESCPCMKKPLICLVAALLLCLAGLSARATVALPCYDAFNYAEGNLNAVGGTNWVLGSGSSTFEIAVSNAAALTASAGFPAATGKRLRRAPSSSSKRSVLQFTSVPTVDGNAVFVSFLLNVPTAPAAAQLIGHLNGSISTEGGAVLVEKSVYINCLYPLHNNQTAPSDPTYTGKILESDVIYQKDSTVVRGNSTDSGSPLGPFQAPIIPFSWNPASGAAGGQLPYSYTPDDPAQLQTIVSNYAGAGILTWAKTNWLKTSY